MFHFTLKCCHGGARNSCPSFAEAQGTHLPATFRCGGDEVPLASVAVWCGASPFTVDCASGFEDFQHFVGQERLGKLRWRQFPFEICFFLKKG